MPESETHPIDARLWTAQGFVADEWRHGESADDLAAGGKVILPLAAFLALDDATRHAHGERIGARLAPGEALEAIVPHLDTLALVALEFPAFSDGRSYSKAELLRRRHGFASELRAVGDVLIDQVSHMLRVGFSTLEISNAVALARLEEGRAGGLPLHYQPAARAAGAGGGYSWRRVPA